jgi:hypothetical protein
MRWGRAAFIDGVARLARHHTARCVMMPRESYSPPRGSLILHASPPPNPPRFLCTYPFLTRFSRAVLEAFRCLKWVMQHIFGKISMSTFQQYNVCANRSSDGRVMTPGSRGVRAIFACFSTKILVKRGKPPVNRELHVVAGVAIFPTHLGPRVNLQRVRKTLRAKAVVREKNAPNLRSIFPHFLSVFARVCDLAPDVGFRRSWYRRKACATLSLKFWTCGKPSLGSRDMALRTGAAGVFLVRWRTFFRLRFRLDRGKSWRSESSTPCMNASSFQRTRARGSTRCESGRLCA